MFQRRALSSRQFLLAEIVPGIGIHCRLSSHYRKSALLKQSACEWIERFKNGVTSIAEAELRKLPFTSNTDKDIKHVDGMILDKRRVTTDEVANHSWFHPWNHPLHTGVSLTTILLKSSTKYTLKCWNILCVARPSPFVLSLQFTQTSLWSHQFSKDWRVKESVPTWIAAQTRPFYLYGYRSMLTTGLSSWKRWETY